MKRFVPLAVFAALIGFAVWGLLIREDRDALPSALMAKPAPDFALPSEAGEARLSSLLGAEPVVVNFWASWCAPCRVEHPKLMELAEMGVPVIGVNYRDTVDNAARFLESLGNPYVAIAEDKRGKIGIEYGVAALPETFVISPEGKIVYKHVGPINPGELEEKVIPAIKRALTE